MMYCLRSYIPLLLLPLPLSLSPVHLTILLALTYVLNRPCIYCSLLLLILFASSCHWSGRCFVDFSYQPIGSGGSGIATWFIPRLYTASSGTGTDHDGESSEMVAFLTDITNNTVITLANAAIQGLKNTITHTPDMMSARASNETGIGIGWIRSLLGRSEWTLPCTRFKIAL